MRPVAPPDVREADGQAAGPPAVPGPARVRGR